jgi:hypothetical protein
MRSYMPMQSRLLDSLWTPARSRPEKLFRRDIYAGRPQPAYSMAWIQVKVVLSGFLLPLGAMVRRILYVPDQPKLKTSL